MVKTRVAVIGGGLSGLVAAYEISRRDPNADVVVFEASDAVGGKLKTVDLATGSVDVGAEAYLAFRADATRFFTSLGLKDRLRYPSDLKSGLWIGDGTLHSVPSRTVMGIPAESSSVKDLVDSDTCARIDAEGEAYAIPWVEGEDALLGALVAERMGQQVVDHVVSPLLGGVYSSRAEDLGLRATIPELAAAMDELANHGEPVTLTRAAAAVLQQRDEAREARLAGGAADEESPIASAKKPPVFASFVGGYRDLIDALIEQSSATIRVNTPAAAVLPAGAGSSHRFYVVTGSSSTETEEFDAVVVATPADVAGQQLAEIAPVAADILGSMDLASSVVLGLRLPNDEAIPETTGILVSSDAGLHAKAFTFSSRKWPHVDDQVGAFIRASFGHWGDDSLVREDEDTLVKYAIDDFEAITGQRLHPEETVLQKWWGGLPRYGMGHDELINVALKDISQVEGLEAAGAIWHGVGVPACIAQAREAAKKVMDTVM